MPVTADISPDGTRVLFRFPAHNGFEGSNLATMNLDGTGFDQLTDNTPDERMLSASYSPDGTRITFARDGIAGLPDVWTMNTDGSDVRRVTSNALWDSGPDWGCALSHTEPGCCGRATARLQLSLIAHGRGMRSARAESQRLRCQLRLPRSKS